MVTDVNQTCGGHLIYINVELKFFQLIHFLLKGEKLKERNAHWSDSK